MDSGEGVGIVILLKVNILKSTRKSTGIRICSGDLF